MKTHRTKTGEVGPTARGYSFEKVVLVILFIFIVCWLALSLMQQPRVKPYALVVKQRAQFKYIETGLELFKSEFEKYPPSGALDEAGVDYCGAMKLCEAVMGQDLMGFHPDSVFRSDGTDGKGKVLYPHPPVPYVYYLDMRKGPYLPLDYANAYSLADLYGEGNTGPFEPNHFILCDVFKHVKLPGTRKKVGMPILYYKADTSKTAHDVNDPGNPENIYNYKDNHALLALGVPGKPDQKHPLYEDPKIFYEIAWDYRANGPSRPYRADTFILLSAGHDGLYGTKDDITNFKFQWKRE